MFWTSSTTKLPTFYLAACFLCSAWSMDCNFCLMASIFYWSSGEVISSFLVV